jgi:hypothetical protein
MMTRALGRVLACADTEKRTPLGGCQYLVFIFYKGPTLMLVTATLMTSLVADTVSSLLLDLNYN